MNRELQKIYREKWDVFSEKLNEVLSDNSKELKPTNPLLLFVDEENYLKSDLKVMIFGQETNDWENDFQNDINVSLNIYNDFYNSKNCFSYGGQFWNGFNRFNSLLKGKFANKRIEIIWNNVIKVGNSGRDKNYPPEYIYKIEKEYFNVINDEINVLKPDIILFVSGPNYDKVIKNSLIDANFEALSDKFSARQIAKIEFKNHNNIFRTYHPNYLWRNNIDSYFNEIIENIKI
jgi:hypothetical protein